LKIGAILSLSLVLGASAAALSEQPVQTSGGTNPVRLAQAWPVEPKWTGPGPMPRHHMALMWGIPEPYKSMTNPLPQRPATLARGAEVYARNCVACHGEQGVGDGPAGHDLSPPPGNLVWLSDMPEKQWDAFMYWAIAEGGTQLGTAMPAFKDTLSKDDIWAVTAYIQANLPFESQWRMRL
jgi:mono/diheme cytochrome c family protein